MWRPVLYRGVIGQPFAVGFGGDGRRLASTANSWVRRSIGMQRSQPCRCARHLTESHEVVAASITGWDAAPEQRGPSGSTNSAAAPSTQRSRHQHAVSSTPALGASVVNVAARPADDKFGAPERTGASNRPPTIQAGWPASYGAVPPSRVYSCVCSHFRTRRRDLCVSHDLHRRSRTNPWFRTRRQR